MSTIAVSYLTAFAHAVLFAWKYHFSLLEEPSLNVTFWVEFLLTLSKVANNAPSPVLSFHILCEHTSMQTLMTCFNVQLNSALNSLKNKDIFIFVSLVPG